MDSNIWHTYTILPCRPWECASIDHACAVPSKSLKIKPRNVHLTVMLVNMQDKPGSPQDQITVHTKMNIKTSIVVSRRTPAVLFSLSDPITWHRPPINSKIDARWSGWAQEQTKVVISSSDERWHLWIELLMVGSLHPWQRFVRRSSCSLVSLFWELCMVSWGSYLGQKHGNSNVAFITMNPKP